MTTAALLGSAVHADMRDQVDVLAAVRTVGGTALEAARERLRDAGLVRLLGIGSSRHAAGIGAAALDVFGIPAMVLPAPGSAVALPAWRDDHAVVVLSQSGETPALLHAVESARAAGTPVIAVTNAAGSTLARSADVAIDCGAGPERVVAATKSVTAQVLVLRELCRPVAPADLTALLDAVQALVDTDPEQFVRGAPPEHVVSSGLGAEWVADEIALKFAEMVGRLLTAEPIVEHLHGPAAVPAATLALLDPADANAAALGLSVVRVGPDPAYDVVTGAVEDPTLAAIVALVAGQCAALGWARRLGADPDAARGLRKVTHSR